MKKAGLVIASVVFVGNLYAQSVATINGKPINSKEFLWIYQKNHGQSSVVDYKDLANYLELYVNFKLKVADAKSMGLDLDTAYVQEIASYERALKEQNKVKTNSPEYTYIMNEYRDGVLMFNVSEQKIWNYTPKVDQELKPFFEKNAKYKGKNFEEMKGQLVGDYQQELEANWIKNLRSKYAVKINRAELKKLAK